MQRQLGAGSAKIVGLRRRPFRDLYHFLLTSSWLLLFTLIIVFYIGVNAVFAQVYLLLGDSIANATPGSFTDAFFFSIQTMATVGYGKMWPKNLAANLLVIAEVLTGMLTVAVSTGLIFAKFARPTARVLFSRFAVIAPYDRTPSLIFRMANERTNQIVDAELHVMMVCNEETAEGEVIRRVHDLLLRRSQSALFGLTWTAVHPITRDSPLWGATAESLLSSDAEVIVSLIGFEEGLSQTIHARHVYTPRQIIWNARLAEILVMRRNGKRVLDFRRFHQVERLDQRPERERPHQTEFSSHDTKKA
jgi:inward rectifier potassium channel